MPFRFNPLSGQLEIVQGQEFAEKIASDFVCESSASVGDVVVPSLTTPNKVDSITSNSYSNLAFGVIIEKITSTSCTVLISGKLSGASFGVSGLSFGKVAYIDASGTITTTVPTSGHLQKMGVAIKEDELFLLPSLEKVILS